LEIFVNRGPYNSRIEDGLNSGNRGGLGGHPGQVLRDCSRKNIRLYEEFFPGFPDFFLNFFEMRSIASPKKILPENFLKLFSGKKFPGFFCTEMLVKNAAQKKCHETIGNVQKYETIRPEIF